MSLLLPLGLLGLISVGALILIYIIKPNYQQKFVSSTYVWKLSLKYKRKNLPINRIRNILMLLCQILILVLCALLLARPAVQGEKEPMRAETVAIIDAGASMRAHDANSSRIERALSGVRNLAEDVEKRGGVMTVVLAGSKSEVLMRRTPSENMGELYAVLDGYLSAEADARAGKSESVCSYGAADLDGAVDEAREIVRENPEADVVLYTATDYIDKNNIRVVDVSEDGEWNAAILDARAEFTDNYYDIYVDVGCYGISEQLAVTCRVYNVNGNGGDMEMTLTEVFSASEEEHTLVFDAEAQNGAPDGARIYQFDSIFISVDADGDSLLDDNYVYLYGGVREEIRVQYSTSDVDNPFVRQVLYGLRSGFRNVYDLYVKQVGPGDAAGEGFDLYIYEHVMPETLPKDGVVFLINPDSSPSGDLVFGDKVSVERLTTLGAGEEHPITRGIDSERITVSSYRKVLRSDGYAELLYCRNDPVLLVKDTPKEKVLLFAGDIHMSNLAVRLEFPLMMRNFFAHFIPGTVKLVPQNAEQAKDELYRYSYRVGDTVELRSRDVLLRVEDPSGKGDEFEVFPENLTLDKRGTYEFKQDTLRTKDVSTRIYVSMNADESKFTRKADSLPYLEKVYRPEPEDKDLVLIFASVLVALLFVEWFLQSREYYK